MYTQRGFTLIELLVVVAIIGLLSSIVFSGTSTARLKARDSSLRTSGLQFRNLLELNKLQYDNYSNLLTSGNWSTAHVPCSSLFSGNYATQARAVCQNIVNNSDDTSFWGNDGYRFYVGTNSGDIQKYSILIWLPGKKTYLCLGSSGRSSESSTVAGWMEPGCYENP